MTVLDNITSRVTTLYPLSDSSHLLTTHKDGSIKLWNVLTKELEREFKGHLSEVQSLSVTNSEELLMSGDLDGHVIIWSLQKGTRLRNFKDHNTQISASSSIVLSISLQLTERELFSLKNTKRQMSFTIMLSIRVNFLT